MTKDGSTRRFPPERPSACAEAGVAAEMKRINSLTIEERILEALSLASTVSEFVSQSPPTETCHRKAN